MAEVSPERIVKYLNCFHEAVSSAVQSKGGIITQCQGDCVVAVFGAPLPIGETSFMAASAAIQLQASMEEVNFTLQGLSLPALNVGVGLSTGFAICGGIGPAHHLQYQAIGEPLYLAVELEKLACVYGSSIVIDEVTREVIKERFHIRQLDSVIIRGKDTAQLLFEIFGTAETNLKHDVMTVTFFYLDHDLL